MVAGLRTRHPPGSKGRAVAIACGCAKNRVSTGEATVTSGTYRVVVNDRQVYESSSKAAADTVAARFSDATIIPPGQ